MKRHTRLHVREQRERWINKRIRFWSRIVRGRAWSDDSIVGDHYSTCYVMGWKAEKRLGREYREVNYDRYQHGRFNKRSRDYANYGWYREKDDWWLTGVWKPINTLHQQERLEYGENYGRPRLPRHPRYGD